MIDRPNSVDRVTEQRLASVVQTVPTSVALYSGWIDKGLLYGGMMNGSPDMLDNPAKAADRRCTRWTAGSAGAPQTRLTALPPRTTVSGHRPQDVRHRAERQHERGPQA